MTEFQELIKDAPKFVSMERGELVAYAYGMYAEGVKTNAENAKLRELVRDMMGFFEDGDWCVKCEACDRQAQEKYDDECLMRSVFRDSMRELGIEVDE